MPEKSGITTTIKLPVGAFLERKDVDHDANGFIDKTEWHALEYLLDHKFPGTTIDRQYWSYGNVHNITPKPAECSACHDKRTRFATATAKVNGESGYSIQLDPGIFIPEFPSLRDFKKTVHGKSGVTCTDCHISQEKISDAVCSRCHESVYHTYKSSLHGNNKSAACTDCHNPHLIKSYKEYNAKERIAVCSNCHKDYISKHKWLPNTALHFKYLECTTCHSPGSEKSMVFFFEKKDGDKKTALTYKDLEGVFGHDVQVRSVINKYTEDILKGSDIGSLFIYLNDKMNNSISVNAEIIVTKVHHDYSVTRLKEKNCVVCHSPQACFYNSMYLNLPGREEHLYTPVKGTLLSTYPLALALDIYVLGEQKISMEDVRKLVHKAPGDWISYFKGLGFKLIDMIGVCLSLLALLGCMVHALLRILVIKR
jgi:predicted CXXCH cytochrome family protein